MAAMIVAVIWVIFLLNGFLPVDLRRMGIRPRDPAGAAGILWAPFLHMDWKHLTANSGPLFVLSLMSLSFSRKLTFLAVLIIILGGGAGVWFFGAPHTVHIGASGVIFGLIGFLFFIGIFQRRVDSILVSVLAVFLYGGTLRGLFSWTPGVSFSSHLCGFLSGVFAAWILRRSFPSQ